MYKCNEDQLPKIKEAIEADRLALQEKVAKYENYCETKEYEVVIDTVAPEIEDVTPTQNGTGETVVTINAKDDKSRMLLTMLRRLSEEFFIIAR